MALEVRNLVTSINRIQLNRDCCDESDPKNDEIVETVKASSYLTWDKFISPEATSEERLRQNAKIVMERYLKYDEEAEDDQDSNISLKYNAPKIIADKGTLTYFHWRLGEEVKYTEAMSRVKNQISICREQDFVEKEYLDGFIYVLDTFDLEVRSMREKVKDEEWNSLKPLQSLPVKTQVGVMSMKNYFIGQLRVRQDLQIETLRQMVAMDPESYEWRLSLFNHLRFQRRDAVLSRYGPNDPGQEELNIIQKALELAPNHPRVLLNFCQLLAEFIKTKKMLKNSNSFPFLFCGIIFTSPDDVVGYLKDNSHKILRQYGTSVATYVKVAEFFTSMLPPEYQDVELSRKCLRRALELNSKSTRAHHRLGITYFQIEPRDLRQALNHLHLAIENDVFNFGAIMDYVQLLMADLEKNSNAIRERLDKIIEGQGKEFWGNQRLADLIFSRGCYYQMTGKESNAIQDWLEGQKIAGDLTSCFRGIETKIWRYGWNWQNLSRNYVISTIRRRRTEFESRAGELDRLESIVRRNLKDSYAYAFSNEPIRKKPSPRNDDIAGNWRR